MRLRFDARELVLLRGAEHLRGATLAHQARPEHLRAAISLAKIGHKLAQAAPGASVSLEEGELNLLLEAVRFGMAEVQWVAGAHGDSNDWRRDTVLGAFPELVRQGLWRSFGVLRDMESIAERLHTARSA